MAVVGRFGPADFSPVDFGDCPLYLLCAYLLLIQVVFAAVGDDKMFLKGYILLLILVLGEEWF